MGAWGVGLCESDTAYDYFDEVETFFPSRELYKIINDDISKEDLALTKEVFKNNKSDLRKMALTLYENDKDIYVLIYIAFLRYFELELDNDDKKAYAESYKMEMMNIVNWSEPEERKKELERLNDAVKNNKKYEFNHKGLFDKLELYLR